MIVLATNTMHKLVDQMMEGVIGHCCITQDLFGFPLSPVCSRDTGYLGLAEG